MGAVVTDVGPVLVRPNLMLPCAVRHEDMHGVRMQNERPRAVPDVDDDLVHQQGSPRRKEGKNSSTPIDGATQYLPDDEPDCDDADEQGHGPIRCILHQGIEGRMMTRWPIDPPLDPVVHASPLLPAQHTWPQAAARAGGNVVGDPLRVRGCARANPSGVAADKQIRRQRAQHDGVSAEDREARPG